MASFTLLPGLVADRTALFLEREGVLVLADLHIGYEEERVASGFLLPRRQEELLRGEVERLLSEYHPRRLVLNGDVKHEFGRISGQEWRVIRRLLSLVWERGCEPVVIAGNHDALLAPLLERLGLPVERSFRAGSALILHGDAPAHEVARSFAGVRLVIIGHEHPALGLSDGTRRELVKAFLVGKKRVGGRSCSLVVMPSWNPFSAGIDVLRERPLGPLLADFTGFRAFAVLDDEVLAFGRVEKLQRLMR